MIINRIPLSHTTSSSQAHSGNEKNKFVQHSDARYIEGDFDPPFAGVRRRLLLVGRTQDRRRLPSQINARAESPLIFRNFQPVIRRFRHVDRRDGDGGRLPPRRHFDRRRGE